MSTNRYYTPDNLRGKDLSNRMAALLTEFKDLPLEHLLAELEAWCDSVRDDLKNQERMG